MIANQDDSGLSYEEIAAILPMAQAVLQRMREEGGVFDEVEEYVDSLIAYTRSNHPELESDPDKVERWRLVRQHAISVVQILLGANN